MPPFKAMQGFSQIMPVTFFDTTELISIVPIRSLCHGLFFLSMFPTRLCFFFFFFVYVVVLVVCQIHVHDPQILYLENLIVDLKEL